jgi:hypothetical protein
MLQRQKFAINSVNFCSIFGRVLSYATQVKVCHKCGEFLLHFWEGLDFETF